jgi:peptidoglycan/xylan/chitin deacetylase (PgdA/CDA1 family)
MKSALQQGRNILRDIAVVAITVITMAGAAMSVSASAQANPAERMVAITFDDLPMASPNWEDQPLAAAKEANRKTLAALKRFRAPATGFVNETHISTIGPGADSLLKGWNRGKYELANHGANHKDANKLDLAGIEREVIDGEKTIGPMARKAGRSLRFFRFPFNHIGDTTEKQARAFAFLKARGYQLAASTIDTSDYIYNKAFTRAFYAGDKDMQTKVKKAYLEHTEKQIAYYADLNRQVLGYEPPAIMLLHVNRLNAETMDAQLTLFRKAGYRFISLAEAQADPVYAQPPGIATRFGPMWGYRWARDRGVKVNGSLEEEPPAWVAEYGNAIPAKLPAAAPPR